MTAIADTNNSTDLIEVKELTMQIRQRQRDIENLANTRRAAIVRLRQNRVTYREIAESMGTTEQNVYKILRDHIAAKATAAEPPQVP